MTPEEKAKAIIDIFTEDGVTCFRVNTTDPPRLLVNHEAPLCSPDMSCSGDALRRLYAVCGKEYDPAWFPTLDDPEALAILRRYIQLLEP